MPGKIVETKLGEGTTNNADKPINGKIIVYMPDGTKVLCNPENLKVIGYWD